MKTKSVTVTPVASYRCQWPVVAPGKEITCEGGKLAAYVYHVNKKHWCGDDFDFIKTFKSALVRNDRVGFIQPEPERWYTLTNYVKMNTAGTCYLKPDKVQ